MVLKYFLLRLANRLYFEKENICFEVEEFSGDEAVNEEPPFIVRSKKELSL